MRGYYISRRRMVDHALRHNDGLKDIALKIKDKCVELIKKYMGTFRRLPVGKKILFLLGNLAKIAGAFIFGMGAINAPKAISQARNAKQIIAELQAEVNSSAFDEAFGYNEGASMMAIPNEDDFKKVAFKAGIKIISGLVLVLAGTVTSTVASA